MPRRGNVPKREILPDPIYGSILVTKLVNSIMLDGKKGVAQKVVYGAFQIVEEKTGKSGLEAFQQAMENECGFCKSYTFLPVSNPMPPRHGCKAFW